MSKVTIEMISKINAKEILSFEKENRSYFESFVPTRGEQYYEENHSFKIMDEIIDEQNQGLCCMYLLRNASGYMVGRVNLFSIVRGGVQKAEIGYRVGQKYNGKGYATLGVKLAIDEAFAQHDLHRIEAGTSPNNIGSQIVLVKNGFQFIGRAHEVMQVNGKWEDSVLFEKLNP